MFSLKHGARHEYAMLLSSFFDTGSDQRWYTVIRELIMNNSRLEELRELCKDHDSFEMSFYENNILPKQNKWRKWSNTLNYNTYRM